VLAGQPYDRSYGVDASATLRLIQDAVATNSLGQGLTQHPRGKFPALTFGISYGGGQGHPKRLNDDTKHRDLIERLRGDKALHRLASYADSESLAHIQYKTPQPES
jgi:hypothetical protein